MYVDRRHDMWRELLKQAIVTCEASTIYNVKFYKLLNVSVVGSSTTCVISGYH
jgi:hypothetical protein